MSENLTIPYINYKGEFSVREVHPDCIEYQKDNSYHGDTWIMNASTPSKKDYRDYCFEDIIRGAILYTLKNTKLDIVWGDAYTRVNMVEVDRIFNKMKGEASDN